MASVCSEVIAAASRLKRKKPVTTARCASGAAVRLSCSATIPEPRRVVPYRRVKPNSVQTGIRRAGSGSRPSSGLIGSTPKNSRIVSYGQKAKPDPTPTYTTPASVSNRDSLIAASPRGSQRPRRGRL